MPENNEEQVTSSQSQTANASASNASQTASQDGDLAIDPTKTYIVNKRLGKTATGSQIRDIFGEVELKRKVESENAKLKEELANMKKEFANMQASLNQLQIQSELAKALKGSKKGDTSDWDTYDDSETNEVDPASIINRIENITEKVIDKKVANQATDVRSMIAQELEQREEQQRQNEYLRQVFEVSQRETIRAFKNDMPDIPDDDIRDITERMMLLEALKEESTSAILAGDREKGADKWHDYVALQRDIISRLAELKEEQRQIDKAKERKKQLESISMGSIGIKETKPEFQRTLNPNKASDNISAIKKHAREIEQQLKRLRQP